MFEKLRTVKNPLTIIAVFAAMAEIGGTAVLPMLGGEVQRIYVWFLIAFPTLLVLLFFGTLNFNHKVLYAPSDFRNDEGFLRTLTAEERRRKAEREADAFAAGGTEAATPPASGHHPAAAPARDEYLRAYSEALDLVARELERQFGPRLRRDVALTAAGRATELDALVELRRGLLGIEVKLFPRPAFAPAFPDQLAARAHHVDSAAQRDFGLWSGSLMLVAVTTFPGPERDEFEARLAAEIAGRSLPVQLQVYDLETLRAKHAGTGSRARA